MCQSKLGNVGIQCLLSFLALLPIGQKEVQGLLKLLGHDFMPMATILWMKMANELAHLLFPTGLSVRWVLCRIRIL